MSNKSKNYEKKLQEIELEEAFSEAAVYLTEEEEESLFKCSELVDDNFDFMEHKITLACCEARYNLDDDGELLEFSSGDAKDSIKKAWEKIVEFFKKCKDYIEKKIRGHFDDLSIELEKKDGDEYIKFFAKNKNIAVLSYDSSDKFTCVDCEVVYKILEETYKAIDKSLFKESTFGNSGSLLRESAGSPGMENREQMKQIANQAQSGEESSTSTDETKFGNLYREYADRVTKKDVASSELKGYINKINSHYQKCIDTIYKISRKAVTKAKDKPGKQTYKKYIAAKNVTTKVLNVKTLIKKQDN